MRGTVYRRFEKGEQIDMPFGLLVAEGDLNVQEGPHPVTGLLERTAVVSSPGKGVIGRLHRAEVVSIAGFGIAITGLETTRIGKCSIDVRQEWWFVPAGHEED